MLPRLLAAALLPAFLAGVGCATGPTGRLPVPPSSQPVQEELGERNVVDAGAEYARQTGMVLAESGEAVRIRPNYWRVRFALPEEGSGKFLELDFDELAQRVTRERVIDINPSLLPIPRTSLPSESSPATGGSGPQ
ncbi:putative lipoprotein [Corallococcus coralloides DSM 2259]|uniref:Putative lipoprotein n=2 Tax=Corallococcus coralloides TaxID=184914 RepID=H8MFU4_CORCM|nr:putative lipoprotein [Corallococcus coralloides DSM 2259]